MNQTTRHIARHSDGPKATRHLPAPGGDAFAPQGGPTRKTLRSEQGYVLVAALVTLLLLTVLGIWATRTTNLELRTAANERLQKQAFYQADSGIALAERLIFHNLLCVNAQYQASVKEDPEKEVEAYGFYQDKVPVTLMFKDGETQFFDADAIKSPGDPDFEPDRDMPSEKAWTFMYCPGETAKKCAESHLPRTYVLIGSEMAAKRGQGLVQSSGYEGFGVGAANVGFYWTYKIRSRQLGGISDNMSRVNAIWQLAGMNVSQAQSEDCHYGKESQRHQTGSGTSQNAGYGD